jgi:DNA-binding NarL/FixJ family response regulator
MQRRVGGAACLSGTEVALAAGGGVLVEGSHTVTVSADVAIGSKFVKEEPVSHSQVTPRSVEAAHDRFRLHQAAVLVDARSTVDLSLPLLWRELTRGLCKVVDGFFTADRCLLLTRANEIASPLHGRRLRVVEAVLGGMGQKSIAIELGVAPSTVALNARLALEALGVHGRPSRGHPLLMLSALAARSQAQSDVAALSYLGAEHGSLRVLSIRRPEQALIERLPPAELAVVRSLIEGESYERIAQLRGTSTRTIANQITAVFRRLKVSGRSELLLRLFREATLPTPPSCELQTELEPNVREIIVG